jgi:3'-phosphoadenosine 5'-phosphosulfate sulfotransferase (PAPS reductase)/FAD synthetase
MKKVRKSEIYVIQNSGGRSSAYMTDRLLSDPLYRDNCIILFQNTGKENNATLDFIHKCEQRWTEMYNHGVVWLEYNPDPKIRFNIVDYESAHRTSDKSKKPPFELLIEKRKYLPNRVARFCTQDLKIRPAKKYIQSLGYKHWTNCIGIRFDEPKRWDREDSIGKKEVFNQIFPMVGWGTTKKMVDDFWTNMPFNLNLKSFEGNCDLCFLKGIGKKRQIIRDDPQKSEWWIEMENKTGHTFRKEFSYSDIVNGINKSPEFQFREDFECDIPCFCNID